MYRPVSTAAFGPPRRGRAWASRRPPSRGAGACCQHNACYRAAQRKRAAAHRALTHRPTDCTHCIESRVDCPSAGQAQQRVISEQSTEAGRRVGRTGPSRRSRRCRLLRSAGPAQHPCRRRLHFQRPLAPGLPGLVAPRLSLASPPRRQAVSRAQSLAQRCQGWLDVCGDPSGLRPAPPAPAAA